MAEELMETETPETQETGLADDYFGSHSELVDDAGNPVANDPFAHKEEEKPVPAAEGVKPGEKPAPAAGNGLKEVPEGFEGRFFEKGEKGVNFKGEDAMKFLFPDDKSPTRFKYSPINVVAEDPNAAPAKVDDVPPWKKQMEEEKKYRTDLRESLLSPLNHFREAMKAGYTPEQALAYAEQKALGALEEHVAERQYELEIKRREELEKEGTTKAERAEIRARAAANEAEFYAEAGGKEGFDKLLFGSMGKDGKPIPGVGSEDIWMLFKMNNPDVQTGKITGKQLNEKMAGWWEKYASNKENLAFAWKIVKGTLFEKMRPYLIDKIRTTAQGQIAANREGNIRRPMGLTPSPKTAKGETQNQALNAFFDPMASREGIASV